MQEFSTVTASSYDAEALAPLLTQKSSEGWSVVSIVSAGTNVVAYLTRGGAATVAAPDASATSTEPVGEYQHDSASISPVIPVSTAEVTAEPVVEAYEPVVEAYEAVEQVADPVASVPSWETQTVDEEITAITPTLPGETFTATEQVASVVPEVAVEAAAAVVATGEPVGWGASAQDVASAASAGVEGQVTGFTDAASGIADNATGYVTDHVDAMSASVADSTAGVSEAVMDMGGNAASSVTDAVGAVAAETTQVAETAQAETAVQSSGVPAGWYADPSGRFELRYWDGNAWTEHVSRAGQQYTDPPVA